MVDIVKRIEELMDLFDEGEVTTANKIQRPQSGLDRQMFEDFKKRNPMSNGGPPRRMYSGRMMTEEQIKALKERRKTYPSYSGPRDVPKKEGMVYDKKTKTFRPRKNFQNIDRSIFRAPKAAETKARKATEKLKNFVEKFKKENNRLPTQSEIMKSVGGKSSSVQKYLIEGVDYAKRATKEEAGRLAGIKSGEVRAVPEGQDPSYVKRAKTLDEASKFLSKQDDADFKKINAGKKAINKYFKSKPELINTTEFGKNIKQLLSLRMDKETGAIFSKVRPDSYYIEKAKEGKLFDIFDIKPVKEGGRSLRFPTNINIAPGQFNQVFIQNQVGKFFAKGVNENALKNVENILKEKNIRVKLPNVGYLGQDNPVAVDRAKGTFPKIQDTLKTMKAPKEILDLFETKNVKKLAAIGCPGKMMGGRVKLAKGENLSRCAVRGINKLQSTDPKNLTLADRANYQAIRKTSQGARVLKNVLGPAALAIEALFVAPFVATDYASGRRGRDIALSALSLGLADQKLRRDELKEYFPEYGKGQELLDLDERLVELERLQKGTKGQRIRNKGKLNIGLKKFDEAIKELPTEESLLDNLEKSRQAEQDLAKDEAERAKQRRSFFDLSDPFSAAGGGIAKLAGVDSGPPPPAGPNSQGLQGLMKRVKKQ